MVGQKGGGCSVEECVSPGTQLFFLWRKMTTSTCLGTQFCTSGICPSKVIPQTLSTCKSYFGLL